MNRKLTLDLDTLSVASFDAGGADDVRGTVNAHAKKNECPWSQPLSCPATVHTCASFDFSCRDEG